MMMKSIEKIRMGYGCVFAGCLMALIGPLGAVHADSLFTHTAARGGTLISEEVARFAVGDIITVLVQEKVTAVTSANTNTKKEADVSSQAGANDNEFLVANKPGMNILNKEELPNWDLETENETKNTGSTQRRSELSTTISCFVKKVLPNGNVMIEGERQMTVNREDSTIVVSGVIRPKDVTPANTITSDKVAGAQVLLKGKGPLWNNQRRGLITRFLDWFSPF